MRSAFVGIGTTTNDPGEAEIIVYRGDRCVRTASRRLRPFATQRSHTSPKKRLPCKTEIRYLSGRLTLASLPLTAENRSGHEITVSSSLSTWACARIECGCHSTVWTVLERDTTALNSDRAHKSVQREARDPKPEKSSGERTRGQRKQESHVLHASANSSHPPVKGGERGRVLRPQKAQQVQKEKEKVPESSDWDYGPSPPSRTRRSHRAPWSEASYRPGMRDCGRGG